MLLDCMYKLVNNFFRGDVRKMMLSVRLPESHICFYMFLYMGSMNVWFSPGLFNGLIPASDSTAKAAAEPCSSMRSLRSLRSKGR